MDHENTISSICPLLASRHDSRVVRRYPTQSNVCRAQTSVKWRFWIIPHRRHYKHLSSEEQTSVCLCEEGWSNCPVYQAHEKAASDRPETAAEPPT